MWENFWEKSIKRVGDLVREEVFCVSLWEPAPQPRKTILDSRKGAQVTWLPNPQGQVLGLSCSDCPSWTFSVSLAASSSCPPSRLCFSWFLQPLTIRLGILSLCLWSLDSAHTHCVVMVPLNDSLWWRAQVRAKKDGAQHLHHPSGSTLEGLVFQKERKRREIQNMKHCLRNVGSVQNAATCNV